MARDWGAWWSVAKEMLREAEGSLAEGFLIGSALLAHQSAEQALTAAWIVESDGNPPHSHDLVTLAEGLKAPEDVLHACRVLGPLYLTSRYPDAAAGDPAKMLDAEIVERAVDRARVVVEWCRRSIEAKEAEE